MSDSQTIERSPWKQHLHGLVSELSQMLQLRRDLAALEIAHDRRLLRRAIILGGIGAVMVVTGLPLLLLAAAAKLGTVTQINGIGWTVILALALVAPGAWILAQTVRKTRSNFYALRGTLSELQEDLIWLRDWVDSGQQSTEGDGVNR